MSKVLVDRELLERCVDRWACCAIVETPGAEQAWLELRAVVKAAQPAEAEGVELTGEYHADCNLLLAALSAVTAERDAAQKDAERYRWLRSVGGRTYSVTTTGEKVSGGIYDHCVDAAMAAKEE